MKITSLIENTTKDENIICEHGLSLFIETGDTRILFDFGQSGDFIKNADKLGTDLKDVDFAILSHGHYDHANGLEEFFKYNDTAKILAHENVFKDYFHGKKYIGVKNNLKKPDRFVFTEDTLKLKDGIYLLSCNQNERTHPNDSRGFYIHEGDEIETDTFLHEQYLLIEEDERRILFSGCSHKGILNILDWFKPDVLIGGFHLMGLETDKQENVERIKEIAKSLNGYDTIFYTCHCTGKKQYEILKSMMGEKLNYLSSGEELKI